MGSASSRPLLSLGNDKLGGTIHSWSIPAVTCCPGSSSVCRRVCQFQQPLFAFVLGPRTPAHGCAGGLVQASCPSRDTCASHTCLFWLRNRSLWLRLGQKTSARQSPLPATQCRRQQIQGSMPGLVPTVETVQLQPEPVGCSRDPLPAGHLGTWQHHNLQANNQLRSQEVVAREGNPLATWPPGLAGPTPTPPHLYQTQGHTGFRSAIPKEVPGTGTMGRMRPISPIGPRSRFLRRQNRLELP